MTETRTDVLLGAGGSIATVLAPVLVERGHRVRVVSRRGAALAGCESVRADLLNAREVAEAVVDGSTVFLLAGLPYRASVWEEQWPQVMRHTIDACSAHGARLIFFDNVYMYGPVEGPMTEQTPVRPTNRKGRVRARIASDVMEAVAAGRLTAAIARAADFYGPHAANSLPEALVFTPLARGKRAKWIGNVDVPHSFTYVPDCGRALAALSDADDVWGQVWHLPTAAPALSGRAFVDMAARALGGRSGVTLVAPWMLRLAGLFDATLRELPEMHYQNDRPYLFDSTRFERRFSFTATSYEAGIAETARWMRSNESSLSAQDARWTDARRDASRQEGGEHGSQGND